MKQIKILHAPFPLGQAWALSRAERNLGYESYLMAWWRGPIDYPADIDLHLKEVGSLKQLYRLLTFFSYSLFRYDVFHFYSRSILPYVDLPILKLFGKKIIFNFQGSDIRQRTVILNELCFIFPFMFGSYGPKSDLLKKVIVWWVSLWADHIFIITPDLKSACPKATLLSHAYDASLVIPTYPQDRELLNKQRKIKILHAPSNRAVKGTDYIVQSIENLQKKGLPITFQYIERVEHKEALKLMSNCDIFIDQIWWGYGLAAVEAMALGKPVISYIDPVSKDHLPFFKELPIISANVYTLESVLQELIQSPWKLSELGKQSRAFVEKHHNASRIAKKLIDSVYTT